MDVAVIGAGWLGGVHAAAVSAAGDRVVAVVDPDRDRAAELAGRHGAVVYPSTEAALERDFDAAVITTPSAGHVGDATTVLRAGREVLVEKPHRLPGQDATELLALLDRAPDVRCVVGMSVRHKAGMQELIEAVRSGELGDIIAWQDRTLYRLAPDALAPWYFRRAVSGGGISVTNGVHVVDRILWGLGDVGDWTASVGRVFPDHECEDIASIAARGAEGTLVSALLVWSDWELPSSEVLVVGTRGTARVSSGDGWSVVTARGQRSGPVEPWERRFDRQWTAFRERRTGIGEVPSVTTLEPVMDVIAGVTRCTG